MQLAGWEVCVVCPWYSVIGYKGQRNAKWPARERDADEAELFTSHLNAGGDSQPAEMHLHT